MSYSIYNLQVDVLSYLQSTSWCIWAIYVLEGEVYDNFTIYKLRYKIFLQSTSLGKGSFYNLQVEEPVHELFYLQVDQWSFYELQVEEYDLFTIYKLRYRILYFHDRGTVY